LTKRYDEIMEKIQVTEEMRARILRGLQKADLTEIKPVKNARFPSPKRALSIAACLAVLLLGAVALPHLLPQTPADPPGLLQPGNILVQVDSPLALSSRLGFEVTDLANLPFVPEEIAYAAYGDMLGEITYSGAGQTAVYRKSNGGTDNSGDYNTYASIKEITVDGRAVTLKGAEQNYVLALWSDGEFAYSLKLSDGLTEPAWRELIAGIDG
jgi:hypothetical protein